MKIKSIEVWKMNLGNTRPYTIAFKTVDNVDCVFLKLTLENGIFGIGAANPSQQVVGESIDDTLATLSSENTDFLIGRDIRDFYGLLDEVLCCFLKTPAARAAIDIAIHDAFTKYLDVPLAAFLGQKIQKMETSVTIGIKNVEETLEEAQEYYDRGFRCLKVKTGREVKVDIERIVKLREKYAKNIRIRVDANQGYNSSNLLEFYDKTKNLDVELVEQPVKSSEIELLKKLPDNIKAIIAVDESLLTPENAFELASPPNAGKIFNIKLMKSGGIYPARQIAQIAKVSGTALMWGCNDESAVSIAAALHTALCFKNTRYIDLDGSLDLVVDAVYGGFKMENGWMSITDKPGLGVELID